MSQTDVSDVTNAVSEIQIEGPGNGAAEEETTIEFKTADGTSGPFPLSSLKKASDALFDADTFVAVPVMDGNATDKLTVSFGGTITFAASDPAGQELFERLTLGKEVDLRVSGVVAKKSGAWKMAGVGTDLEREVVTGAVGVKVEDIYLLSPEDL